MAVEIARPASFGVADRVAVKQLTKRQVERLRRLADKFGWGEDWVQETAAFLQALREIEAERWIRQGERVAELRDCRPED